MRSEQAALLLRVLVTILQARQERAEAARRIANAVRQGQALLVRIVLFLAEGDRITTYRTTVNIAFAVERS